MTENVENAMNKDCAVVPLQFMNEDINDDKENLITANQKNETGVYKCEESDIEKKYVNSESVLKFNEEEKVLLAEELSKLREKRKQYDEVLKNIELLEKTGESFEDCEGEWKKLENRLTQVTETKKQCSSAIEASNERRPLLEMEFAAEKRSFELKEKLVALVEESERFSKQDKESELEKYLTNLIVSLSGFQLVQIATNSVTVKIQDIDGQLSTVEERPTISLTVQFVATGYRMLVDNVQSDTGIFFIKDLIKRVKRTNDLRAFLLSVQKRFHNEAMFIRELKTLQERFAIDWNEEKQTVRVMIGRSGKVVCTLKIENGYPTTGHVAVEEISGADKRLIFEDTTDEPRNLTDWIEYLFAKYDSL